MWSYSKEKIKELLADETINLNGLSRRSGLGTTTLWRLKTGSSVATGEQIAALASALRVTPLIFFDEIIPQRVQQDVISPIKEPA